MFNFGKSLSKKAIVIFITVAFAGMTLTGCGGGSGGSSETKSEINVAVNAQPDSYDIMKTTATVARQMMLGNVFEMLVTFDADYKVQPELAEKIDVNENYTEYVYHLRKGVKFHNGQEMKADDVVASMNRWIDSSSQAKAATGGAQFVKVDDYTVKITMPVPSMMLNSVIAGLVPAPIIVPKSVIDNADPKTKMIKEYIGTGPYKVDSIKQDDYMKLVKFDDYKPYGEKGKASGWYGYKEAKTPTIIFHFVKDPSTRVAGLQSGEYDLALMLPIDDYGQFKDNKDFAIDKEEAGNFFLSYNKKEGISTNPKFRQAINAAINDQDVLTAALVEKDFYRLEPSYMMIHKNEWYTDIGKASYNQHNLEKAKELLKESGYNGEPFRILVSSSYQEFYNAAVVVERELKDIGVNVQLNVVDWGTFLSTRRDPTKHDAFITGTNIVVVPNQILYLSSTWDGWADDAHLQSELKKIATSTNKQQAIEEWKQLQKYCWEEYVPISLFGDYYWLNVASAKVKDLISFEGPHMWNLTVSK